jgi:hypothetical protein
MNEKLVGKIDAEWNSPFKIPVQKCPIYGELPAPVATHEDNHDLLDRNNKK